MRRQSNPDGGVQIPPDTDPLLERHLLAMDRVFLEERNLLKPGATGSSDSADDSRG